MTSVALLLTAGLTAAPGTAADARAAASPAARLAAWLQPRPLPAVDLPPLATRAAAALVPGVLMVTMTGQGATDRVAGGQVRHGRSVVVLASRVARVDVPPGAEQAAAHALAAQPGVVAVERARRMSALAVPDDTYYDRQWAHQLTGVESAWDLTRGAHDVVVAVLDDGVDARHPDLVHRVVEQRRFTGGTSTSRPRGSDNRQCDSAHGTHVAGIVGAQGGDGAGVAGVMWDVSLLDYAVSTGDAGGGCGASEADVIAALQAAADAGADVANLSLGSVSGSCSTAFQATVDAVRAAGTVVVAAAGNSGGGSIGSTSVPASCRGVISVAAVTSEGLRAGYSSANAHVDLAAPGGDGGTGLTGVLSTVGDDGHDWLEGTSMAAPYVSGLAGLLRAKDRTLTPDEVEGLLEAGAETGDGRNAEYGWGAVSAARSFALLTAGGRPRPASDPSFPVGGDGGELLPPPEYTPQVFRVSAGTDSTAPVAQAVAMSQTTFDAGAATHAVLAREDVFADALAGSSLTLGLGPLLFAGPAGPLPAATRGELVRTLPHGSTVYLLGGASALPVALEAELAALGLQPRRLSGATREDTAVAVAAELAVRRAQAGFPDNGVAVLATDGDWPDAVAAGALGAYYGLPLLLTPPDALHPATAKALRDLRPTGLLVVGGPKAVSDEAYAAAVAAAQPAADGAVRLSDGDRYGTAVQIAGLFAEALAEGGVRPRCLVAANVVRPDGWAHALSASPLAGAYGCVVLPVHGETGHRLAAAARDHVDGLDVDGVLAGDRDVVSDAAATELATLLQR